MFVKVTRRINTMSLKDKWLDYYAANQTWLEVFIKEGGHYTSPSNGEKGDR